jgi:hypothetical protein
MGRARAQFDEWAYHDLASMGVTKKQAAAQLGLSVPTLERNIAELSASQGVILKYRDLQHLKLTEIQQQVLEAITPEKIAECSALELTQIFKILKVRQPRLPLIVLTSILKMGKYSTKKGCRTYEAF